MASESERHLAYAEAQANHPDPQLRSLLSLIYGPSLQRLRNVVAWETAGAAVQEAHVTSIPAK